MRMWNVNPKLMCNQHLLGEHLEMHMFVGALNKNHSVRGYILNGLLDPGRIKDRHDELVLEMTRRKMNHKSPLQMPELNPETLWPIPQVNAHKNLQELARRCSKCKKIQNWEELTTRRP